MIRRGLLTVFDDPFYANMMHW